MQENDIFARLFEVIAQRKSQSPETSYVAKLTHRGTEAINAKITEEAQEVCQAGLEDDKAHLVYELCDLLFHAFVLAGHKDVTLDEIRSELTRRFGTSGLTEKARRTQS